MRYAQYPTILLDVLCARGITLLLNLENWDFLPPQATLISTDLQSKTTRSPGRHIVLNKNTGLLWFCSPGFFEYHTQYPVDRWDLIRGTYPGSITGIVEQACNMIDRTNRNE